jgi:hypothetical protein
MLEVVAVVVLVVAHITMVALVEVDLAVYWILILV